MSFTYNPLNSANGEIRLLKVPSSSNTLAEDSDSDPVPNYSLVHVSLDQDDVPVYETISYCWRAPQSSSPVCINDMPLNVPISTAQVLQQVAVLEGQRYVWIDAVCINQTDFEERASQVQLMRRIYSKTTRDIVCLGRDEGTVTKNGFDAIRAIVEEIRQETLTAGFDTFGSYLGAIWAGKVEVTSLSLRTHFDEDALSAFYSNSWFGRTWIVQEVVLASQSVCLCGPYTIDLTDVLQVATWLGKHPAYNKSERFQPHRGLMNAVFVLEARSQLAFKGGLQISAALAMSSQLQTTDLRDKVYGMLGLCFQNEIPDLLSVDYRKPWQHVYRDATKYAILNTDYTESSSRGLPHILRWISHREEADLYKAQFSSWMPRVDREGDNTLDDMTLFVHGIRELSGDEAVIAKASDDPRSILLHGSRLCTVQSSTPILDSAILQDKDRLQQHFDNLLELARAHNITSKQLARTLIGDTNFRSERSTSDDRAGFTDMLDHINRKATIPDLSDILADAAVEAQSSTTAATFYWTAFLQCSRNRRCAITDDGGFALVPKTCQDGDVVVAVYCDAGGTPYVLRPDAEGFKLVGGCYLDSHMPWQDLEESSKEERISEWFQVY